MTGARILLVDDLPESIDLLSRLLKRHFPDSTILTALNGIDGLNLARKENPDVVLLDAVMPGLDGFETCKTLKADAKTNRIPVLMVSGVPTQAKDRVEGLECGADGYLCSSSRLRK